MSDRFWKLLLPLIGKERVIPVIGRDLLRVTVGGKPVLFYEWLALQLAEELDVHIEDPAKPPRLHELACRFLDGRGLIDEVYIAIQRILDKRPVDGPPDALLKLARIPSFRLFVSITFDTLLEQAVNQVRGSGRAPAHSLVYSLNNDFDDLPAALSELDRPAVYQLMGRASAIKQSYAVTDEDVIEFMHALQLSDRRPKRLFDALTDGPLLLIGNGFAGWLSKFFLRTLNKDRLWMSRDKLGFVVDPSAGQDEELRRFLDLFSFRMLVYGGAPEAFVDELLSRWEQAHPAQQPGASPEPPAPPADGMPRRAVFLSYASEDRDTVRRIQRTLDEDGIDAWFDRSELQPGDLWADKIKSNLERASLFVPIISRSVLRPQAREFRVEWEYALEIRKRLPRDPSGAPAKFILPLVIDDTDMQTEGVRPYFGDLQAQSCPGGELPRQFREAIKALFRQAQKSELGTA